MGGRTQTTQAKRKRPRRTTDKPFEDRPAEILQRGRRILRLEADAVGGIADHLDAAFVQAVETVANCAGKVVVTGVGKAGLIGQKIAATFSSTGTSAIFLHPADAVHGDIGMVAACDVVLALSNSGKSDELGRLLPLLDDLGARLILITGAPDSPCAKVCHIVLSIGRVTEACPLGLAPSSSTTAILAMGDAVALTVLEEKEFHRDHYARLHPAGHLGRQLMKVGQIMRRGERCPRVLTLASVLDAINAIARTPGRAGAVSVVNEDGKLIGFFTDGDLRRLVSTKKFQQAKDTPIAAVMTADPKTARQDDLVVDACQTLRRYKIDELPVVDRVGVLVGVLDIQDLLLAGFSDAEHDA